MLFHGEKCRHCHGNMSERKAITAGSGKSGYRTICVNCGHVEYQAAPHQPPPQAPPQTMPPQFRPQQPGQPRKPILFTG